MTEKRSLILKVNPHRTDSAPPQTAAPSPTPLQASDTAPAETIIASTSKVSTSAAFNSMPLSEQTGRRLVNSIKGLGTVMLVLSLIIACFHPWTKQAIEETLSITPLLLLVLIFVYVVNPIVEFLMVQIRKIPGAQYFSYTKSLIVTYVLLLVLVLGLFAFTAPQLFGEIKNLAENFPAITQKAVTILTHFRQSHLGVLPSSVQNNITDLMNQAGSLAGQLINSGLQYAGAFSSAVIWVATAIVMVPFISFYMLSDGQGLVDFWINLLPIRKRKPAKDILLQLHSAMQSFIKGQVLLCCAVGGLTTLLMALVMPKYCIALGIIAGITEAIPIVGPILGAIPAVFLALALPETGGITLALIVIAVYTLIQQAENNFLVPKIMGDSLGLHPLSLMIGMMVFANVFGFWGVVLASPIVAAVRILVIHYCNPELEAQLLKQLQQAEQKPQVSTNSKEIADSKPQN